MELVSEHLLYGLGTDSIFVLAQWELGPVIDFAGLGDSDTYIPDNSLLDKVPRNSYAATSQGCPITKGDQRKIQWYRAKRKNNRDVRNPKL